MKLSIIVPMFNEENSITECIKRVDRAVLLKNISKEIINKYGDKLNV